MAVVSMSCVQLALALSVHLFSQLGPLGVAGLRLAWAGLLLLILVRPRPRDFTGRDLRACCVLGVVTAGLMMFFMLAIARIPLGTASALEFLGPLTVSVCGPGRGRKRWTVMAAAGVVLLTQPWHGGIDGSASPSRSRPRPAGRLHPAHPARRRPGRRPERAGRLHARGRGLRHAGRAAGRRIVRAGPGDLACLLIVLGLAALHPVLTFSLEIPLPAPAHREGLRHPDEPGTRDRAPGGLLVLGQIPGTASAAGISSWSSPGSALSAPARAHPRRIARP